MANLLGRDPRNNSKTSSSTCKPAIQAMDIHDVMSYDQYPPSSYKREKKTYAHARDVGVRDQMRFVGMRRGAVRSTVPGRGAIRHVIAT